MTTASALPPPATRHAGVFSARAAMALCVLASALVIALPAWLNGFPFLFWDTGGYLSTVLSRAVVPGRSISYGLLLLAGSRPDFWPVVIVQSLLCAWLAMLMLRVHGLGGRPLLVLASSVILSIFTALPFIAGQLMPDALAACGPLALYLLVWKGRQLGRVEMTILVATVALAGACHASALAAQILLLLAALGACLAVPALRADMRWRLPVAALVLSALINPLANLAIAGRFAATPGGIAFVFGRLLEDGMVARYLADHCPQPAQPLCMYRNDLPDTANDFLWDDDAIFNAIGGMQGGEPYMRAVIIGSLKSEPIRNAALAVRAFARQMVTVGTGESFFNYLTDSYEVIDQDMPASRAAMMGARQQSPQGIDLDDLNLLHVPVAIGATFVLLAVFIRALWTRQLEIALLTGSFFAILAANAAVCGILSNPTDRYQARVAWIAVLGLLIVALKVAGAFRSRSPGTP